VLIANQKLQIAAETSNFIRDILGRIELTLSRKSADFQTGIDRFKAAGMEMTNIMLDMNEVVNNINKKVKRVMEKENNKLLTEVKNTQMETIDVIKNQSLNTNGEFLKNRKVIEKIPSIFQISIAFKDIISTTETVTEEIKSIISENLLPKEEEQLNHLSAIQNQIKKVDIIETQDNEIMKKIDIMEANLIKKNEETLNKIENLVQNLTSNPNERQKPPL
jgi:hypothetical protein